GLEFPASGSCRKIWLDRRAGNKLGRYDKVGVRRSREIDSFRFSLRSNCRCDFVGRAGFLNLTEHLCFPRLLLSRRGLGENQRWHGKYWRDKRHEAFHENPSYG